MKTRVSRLRKWILLTAAIAIVGILLCFIIKSPAKTEDKVYFLNTVCDICKSDMILIESNGRFGLIDASNREQNTITDENHKVFSCSEEDQLSVSSVMYKNGRQLMQYLIHTVGVDHLDFIIATHSHSDHIGGIPEIAELKNSRGKPIVDNNTVYFYKTYRPVNEENDVKWLNSVFFYQALHAMQMRQARLTDVSKGLTVSTEEKQSVSFDSEIAAINSVGTFQHSAVYDRGSEENWYDDCLTFKMGDFTISLYNLFSTETVIDENVNSIVTLISKGTQTICCAGDINVESYTEQKIAAAISARVPLTEDGVHRITVYKAAHHGTRSWSNSKETAALLLPQYVVSTGSNDTPAGSFACFKYWLESEVGTLFYSVADAGYATVVSVGENNVSIQAMDSEKTKARYTEMPIWSANMTNGWARWEKCYTLSEPGPENCDYLYFRNGSPVKGWLKIHEVWYYFKDSGIMAANEWCDGWYLNADGAWTYPYKATWRKNAKGWWFGDESGWYAKSCTITIDSKSYTFDAEGYMQQAKKEQEG